MSGTYQHYQSGKLHITTDVENDLVLVSIQLADGGFRHNLTCIQLREWANTFAAAYLGTINRLSEEANKPASQPSDLAQCAFSNYERSGDTTYGHDQYPDYSNQAHRGFDC